MSALPPDQMRVLRETAQGARAPIDSLARRWEALGVKAEQLARLAGLGADHAMPATLPDAIGQANEWQRDLVWRGVEDIEAMLQPGLAALRILGDRGQDPSAPALALWRELHGARSAILRLLVAEEAGELSAPAL